MSRLFLLVFIFLNFAQVANAQTISTGDYTATGDGAFGGNKAGPWLPPVKIWTITNPTSLNIIWSASENIDGMSITSALGGTLNAGQSVSIAVSPDANADDVRANQIRTGTLTLKAGFLTQTRNLRLEGKEVPSIMTISPTDGFVSTGEEGGPFSPREKSYTITNTGGSVLSFSAESTVSEITMNYRGPVVLLPGGTSTVEVIVNGDASALSASTTKMGQLRFSDQSNNETVNIPLRLNVQNVTATNDNIADALLLTGASGSATIPSNMNFTTEFGERTHFPVRFVPGVPVNFFNKSAWFKWTAPKTGQAIFDSLGGTVNNTGIAAYYYSRTSGSLSVSNITQLASDASSAGSNDGRIWLHVIKDVDYYFVISAALIVTPPGSYKINWRMTEGDSDPLLAAVLPGVRSVRNTQSQALEVQATAFATLINTGTTTAKNCNIQLPPKRFFRARFQFQTVDKSNNLTGGVNLPVDIPAGGSQGFVFGITPGERQTTPFDFASVTKLVFDCENTNPVVSIRGLNDFILGASNAQIADLIPNAVTVSGDGIVNLPGPNGSGFFVSSVVNNNGPAANITASVKKSAGGMPVDATLCRTNPTTGACVSPIGKSVTWNAATNLPYTFTIYVKGRGKVPFDPANARLFLEFFEGTKLRGQTSIAVRTQ